MHNMHIAIYCICLSYFYICSTYAIRIIVKIENSQPCLGHLDRVIAKVQMHLASCSHGPPRCTKIEVATCLECLEWEHFDRNEVLILTGSRHLEQRLSVNDRCVLAGCWRRDQRNSKAWTPWTRQSTPSNLKPRFVLLIPQDHQEAAGPSRKSVGENQQSETLNFMLCFALTFNSYTRSTDGTKQWRIRACKISLMRWIYHCKKTYKRHIL